MVEALDMERDHEIRLVLFGHSIDTKQTRSERGARYRDETC